jgi:DedD protein
MPTTQDTEITLGTGKMLTLFFGLVILCAVFFGMGFSMGRNSSKPPELAQTAQSSTTTAGVRPAAVKQTSGSSDMTFYKAVGQKDVDANLATPEPTPAPVASSESKTDPDPTTAPPSPGYVVQVAAVTKQEDADALIEALKKKQYPAFAASNTPSDKLIHIQVGPFTDIKAAEGTRSKLVSDGYNPILKK